MLWHPSMIAGAESTIAGAELSIGGPRATPKVYKLTPMGSSADLISFVFRVGPLCHATLSFHFDPLMTPFTRR